MRFRECASTAAAFQCCFRALGVGAAKAPPSEAEQETSPMNLVEWLQHLMTNFGAAWVMWLMIGLSVASVTIMLERGWFYYSIRDDIPTLAQALRERLRDDDLQAAMSLLEK